MSNARHTPVDRFPIGGPREPVYAFLRAHGWVMSNWSDKHWDRADGLKLGLYGAGSRAVIQDKDNNEIADGKLDEVIAALAKAKGEQ